MISLAYAALWLFVFSVPWEGVIRISQMAVVSRATGVLAFGLAMLAIVMSGRIRRWHLTHIAALLFVLWSGCGLLLINFQGVPKKFYTFVQLFAAMWMIWELAPSRQKVLGLLTAYLFGAYLAAIDTVIVYRRQGGALRRFAAGEVDPNDLAMTLALAVPLAWYLGQTYHRPVMRWIARGYLPLGILAIGLTGSRGGMLATMVALMIVPLTMTHLTAGRLVSAIAMLLITGSLAVAYVPTKIVNRLATTGEQVEDLSLGGRFKLWKAGMTAFTESPLIGYGTASYIKAITPQLGPAAQVAHNSYISVLVEEGAIGFMLYATMLFAVFLAVLRLQSIDRRFGLVLYATLGIAMLPLTWEDRKAVWVILAALVGLSYSQVAGSVASRWQAAPRRVPVIRPTQVPRPKPMAGPRRSPGRDASA
ncbi:MAG TPA: O-antigen ligase family protein [Gemmatimonadales bacterium]|jgi:O-antigen ligase|nr:O-antigen ligase family protein [Gemmatimonadales bacterium]